MDKKSTCCFTGHRPEVLFVNEGDDTVIFEKIYNAVENAIKDGYTDFICGACRGGDFLFAEAVIQFRREYADIRLVSVLPCKDQARNWDGQDRDKYADILDASDSVICLNEKYVRGCMHQRNRYMVDRSSLLICAFNGSSGGTEYTYKYAKKSGLRIENVIDIKSEPSDQLSFL